jgi:rhamnogalacturonan endolyase
MELRDILFKHYRVKRILKRRAMPLFLFLPILFSAGCGSDDYKKDELIFEDSFEGNLSNWIIETEVSEEAKATIEDGKLVIDVDRGATVWLDKKLSGNISIEYDRKVVMEDGKNDRLSDLNQFWMAGDPKNLNLFTRRGVFEEYDSLQLYYFGIGGNRNTTTRFRKYTGTGDKDLIHNFNEEKYMLEPNKTYQIKTIVYNGVTKVFLDGEELFSYKDKEPYKEGYFGIRTTESRQEIDNVKIYSLK